MACIPANNASTTASPNLLFVNNLKKGKSEMQCKCIDFFFAAEGQQKSGGCFKSVDSSWSIDDYCAYVQKTVNGLNLKERALAKIGLDESQVSEIPPILLASFCRGKDLYYKTNETRSKFVTNQYSVTYIFFSATQIYTYTYIFDTVSDNSTESTRDFFYSDVTCIRTEHEVEEVIYESVGTAGCLKKSEEKFTHYNRNWDTLQITVPNDSYSFCCRTTDTLEQSIQAAKAMIREKKQA